MKKKLLEPDNINFIKDRNTIRDFISRVRRVQYLAMISGVSKSTVERTFRVDSFESLSGNMITVWENAVKMHDEFELLRQKTHIVAKQIREAESGYRFDNSNLK